MSGTDGLNVIQKIAAGDYKTFGMRLLQDENGMKVNLIEKNNRQEGAEGITRALLNEWLRDGPEHTRTYDHLIDCLKESGLGALADDIATGRMKKEQVVPHQPPLLQQYLTWRVIVGLILLLLYLWWYTS